MDAKKLTMGEARLLMSEIEELIPYYKRPVYHRLLAHIAYLEEALRDAISERDEARQLVVTQKDALREWRQYDQTAETQLAAVRQATPPTQENTLQDIEAGFAKIKALEKSLERISKLNDALQEELQ